MGDGQMLLRFSHKNAPPAPRKTYRRALQGRNFLAQHHSGPTQNLICHGQLDDHFDLNVDVCWWWSCCCCSFEICPIRRQTIRLGILMCTRSYFHGFCRKFAKFQKILWMWCGSQNRRKKAQSMTLGWKPHNGMWDVDNSCQSEQIIFGLFHLKSASTAPVSWQLRAIALRREDYQRDREAHTYPANGNHPTSSTSNEKRKCILAHQEKL